MSAKFKKYIYLKYQKKNIFFDILYDKILLSNINNH